MYRAPRTVLTPVIIFAGALLLGAAAPDQDKQAPPAPKDKVPAAAFPQPVQLGKDSASMVPIAEGCFTMGTNNVSSDQGFPNERPEHTVCLKSYYIDQFEVTTQRYAKFMQEAGAGAPPLWDEEAVTAAADRPVIGISWSDAEAYCKWAGKRLPTEAEWEKAARGTDGRRYPWGFMTPYPDLANYNRGDWVSYPVTMAPVIYGAAGLNVRLGFTEQGGRSPYGLYNVAGNAAEWVADWYDREYYTKSPKDNPTGPASGEKKIFRGGSWIDPPRNLRVTARFSAEPDFQDRSLGFRCAMDMTETPRTAEKQS